MNTVLSSHQNHHFHMTFTVTLFENDLDLSSHPYTIFTRQWDGTETWDNIRCDRDEAWRQYLNLCSWTYAEWAAQVVTGA